VDAGRLERYWYGDAVPPLWTRLLAQVYATLVALRSASYRRGWLSSLRLPVPVVVIGNLTVGGTGKTPLTIALVEALRARGFRPGVVSRGYGGHGRGLGEVMPESVPGEVGDEPCLIRRQTGAPVIVGRDRVEAARRLVERHAVDVVLADDGLQHYRLARDVEICVIDGARRFGNRRLLPAGPLREPLDRLEAIDLRVCNGATAASGEFTMRLVPDEARCIARPGEHRPLATFIGQCVHAVAGIGNPQRFFDSLAALGLAFDPHAFPDHHAFHAGDLDFGDTRPVLMTEKDAVKVAGFARERWWFVPVRAELPEGFFDEVARRLRNRVRT